MGNKILKSLCQCSNQLLLVVKESSFLSLQVCLTISVPALKILTVVSILLTKKYLKRSLYRLKFLRLSFIGSLVFDLMPILCCPPQNDFLLRHAVGLYQGLSASRSLSRMILLIKLKHCLRIGITGKMIKINLLLLLSSGAFTILL